MVEGLCRGLLRDPSDYEDAAQQTFLSAYRALLGGCEPRDPAAWLATIARNECLGRIRERMRRPLPVAELEEQASSLPDPLAEAIGRADLEALWAEIALLPRQQRDALLMREFAGLRYDELAVALGVTEPAVESLLFRARTHLRAALQPAYGLTSLPLALRELLARLAGAGAAAKLGTTTVGVALLAGGAAVVAPRVEEHRQPLAPPAFSTVAHPSGRVAAEAGPAPPTHVVAVEVAAPVVAGSVNLEQHGNRGPDGRDQHEDGNAHQIETRTTTQSAAAGDHSTEGGDSGTAGQLGDSGSRDSGETDVADSSRSEAS